MYAEPRDKKITNKAQITLDYVLSIVIIISIIFSTVLLISNYNEVMVKAYENTTMRSIIADVSYTITSIYVIGHESKIIPEIDETVMVVRGNIVLPKAIKSKFYIIEINNSENSVCGSVNKIKECKKIVGVPLGFNITDVIEKNRTIGVVYWRERNETNDIRDYILVG